MFELDDIDKALIAKASDALNREQLGELDHDDIADLIQLIKKLTPEQDPDLHLTWPRRVMYLPEHGYVVWRDVFEGRELKDPQKAALMHQDAIFVVEAEAIDYCRYRNARALMTGHDGVDA